jgi:hypothetical protein
MRNPAAAKTYQNVVPTAGHHETNSLGIVPVGPHLYADYVLESARLKSFLTRNWPSGLQQKPEALVEAGFFYTGLRIVTAIINEFNFYKKPYLQVIVIL